MLARLISVSADLIASLMRAAIICLLLPALLINQTLYAAFLGEVLGNPGKIMDGDKVLAEVPRGTRLWVFSEKPGWSEVKVPGQEQHGWMSGQSIEPVKLSEQQRKLLDQVVELQKDYGRALSERQYDVADKHGRAMIALLERVWGKRQHPGFAILLQQSAWFQGHAGDFSEARKLYDEALAIQRNILGNNQPETAKTLYQLGNFLTDQGDYAAARLIFDEALAIQRQTLGEVHIQTGDTLHRLANISRLQGKYPAARKYFSMSLTISRKLNDNVGISISLNGLGTVAEIQGDYAAARKFYVEALAIMRRIYGKQDLNTAEILTNLGNVTAFDRDFKSAQEYYDEALAIKRKLYGDQHLITAYTMINRGLLAAYQLDYPTARKYYDQTLTIYRRVHGEQHPEIARVLNCLANVVRDEGDFATARKYYEQALAIERQAYGPEHIEVEGTLRNLAFLAVREKDDARVIRDWDESRRIVRKHTQRTLPALSSAEQLVFLENAYQRDWFHSLSVGLLLRNNQLVVNKSADWLINGKAIAQESLAASELLGRDLRNPRLAPLAKELQSVRQRLASLANSIPQAGELAKHQATLAQLTSEELRLTRELTGDVGSTAKTQGWITLEDVRRNLSPGQLYIDLLKMPISDLERLKSDFAVRRAGPPNYVAWVIPPAGQGEVRIIDLGAAATIDNAIEQARKSLANAAKQDGPLRNEGELAATAQAQKDLRAVADLVMKPLLSSIGDSEQLLLSPDGALWLLPWAALPTVDNKFLLEQCSLRYVLSGRDVGKLPRDFSYATSAPAIFANPEFDQTGAATKAVLKQLLPKTQFDNDTAQDSANESNLPQVSPLQFTEIEGQAAQPLLKALAYREPRSYLREQALETVVKSLQKPHHLLFATHGFFLDEKITDPYLEALSGTDTRATELIQSNVENPLLRCGLLLAGCNSPRTPGIDDGILTGLEIVSMDLRGTQLVVLSACETGIGKVRNGEGVAGLRQAFQLAGAQSVVSTLWQVPDRDSAIIMQDFFKNLAAGQSKADALRNAQLSRIAARKEKYGAAHPFFWAAWTVTGE